MTDWDAGQVYYSQQLSLEDPTPGGTTEVVEVPNVEEAQKRFYDFLRNYRVNMDFVYREQLMQRHRSREYFVDVDLKQLLEYDAQLYEIVEKYPNRYLPVFERAAKAAMVQQIAATEDEEIPEIQIMVHSDNSVTPLREINANHVNKLLTVTGIVINASRARAKACGIAIRCKSCNDTKILPNPSSFGTVQLPRTCTASAQASAVPGNAIAAEAKCPLDPYVVEPDKCHYVDQQTLKLQEAPDDVPTGEMPRHLLCSVSRHLVDRAAPGSRVRIMGVYSIFTPKRSTGGVTVRQPYLHVVGISMEAAGAGRNLQTFSAEEEAEFRSMAEKSDVYKTVWQSIAPAVSGGYTEDIKKAIACLLVGGSRRVLPDGMKLRGDINVLLLGDPSTAKSQFLKFVEKVAPVGVYTSGKGSSAAGLTASVIRDAKGEFYLEGGAMVLADGGVVCIDEFDKMREEDRVAIHEAMEQQTISVAKAGITTILNSRAAVLAAANPVFGRYDDSRTAAENIDFLPTILSRFDLIFVVRDVREEARDKAMALHVIRLHTQRAADATEVQGELDLTTLKRYIAFVRARCAPKLDKSASDRLMSHYVKIREDVRKRQQNYDESSAVPITVRQLEALIRITEAIAKISLSPVATEAQATEAIRLFTVATLHAANSGSIVAEGFLRPEMLQRVQTVEGYLKQRVPIGNSASVSAVVEEMLSRGFDEFITRKAIWVLVQRGEFKHKNQQRNLERLR